MLEMERRLESSGLADAPRFGRKGVSGFLEASFVALTSDTAMCALTGAVLSTTHAKAVAESARGGLLALPPGVGKTYTCVALSALAWTPGKYAAVVVCPRHLVLQWKDEIARFFPTACIANSHEASRDLVTAPTFLVAAQDQSIHAAAYASVGVGAPASSLDGAVADRYIVDEAHSAPVPYPGRRPACDESVWAVTATPFFARTARAASLFDILQKIPRHFGIPTIHAQLARILRREVGAIFREFVLNLHELQNVLPRVQSSEEMVVVRRATAQRGTVWVRSYRDAQAHPSPLYLERVDEAIIRAASLGLVLHADEFTPFQDAARRMAMAIQRMPFPAWPSIPCGRTHSFGDEDCVVCLSSMEGENAVSLACGHSYHHACLDGWHTQGAGVVSRCPTCRAPYQVSSIVRRRSEAEDSRAGEQGAATRGSSPQDPQEQPVGNERRWEFDEVHIRATELVEAHLAKNEGKAIVFLPQAAAARLGPILRSKNVNFVSCIDAAGPLNRAIAIRDFVEGSAARVLLIDPLSFETGLNLTVANFVLSYPYHRGSVEQMAGRVRRLGQRFQTRFVQLRVDCADLIRQAE